MKLMSLIGRLAGACLVVCFGLSLTGCGKGLEDTQSQRPNSLNDFVRSTPKGSANGMQQVIGMKNNHVGNNLKTPEPDNNINGFN
jgi:hypothetical protein